MRIVVLSLYIFLVFGCGSWSTLDIGKKDDRIEKLKKISNYLTRNNNGVYDLQHSNIPLPENYDTIVWKQLFGKVVTGLDSTETRGRLFIKMIEDVISESKLNKPYTLNEVNKYFGKPSELGSRQYKSVSHFYYWFNTISYPDCADFDQMANRYLYCSLLSLKFDEKGYLVGVGSNAFWL